MERELNILILDDDLNDVMLASRALRKAGLVFHCTRAETEEDFRRGLEQESPDVILSDHGLPPFDGFAALALAKEKRPETPFIFVTGALGNEAAAEAFAKGAADFVVKHRLTDLASVVRRALLAAQERRMRRQAESDRERLVQELEAARAMIRALSHWLPTCAVCKKTRDSQGSWIQWEDFVQIHGGPILSPLLCPECARKHFQTFLVLRPEKKAGG